MPATIVLARAAGAYGKSDEPKQSTPAPHYPVRALPWRVAFPSVVGAKPPAERVTAQNGACLSRRSPKWVGRQQKNFDAPLDACRLW